jgi:hypothetical protein
MEHTSKADLLKALRAKALAGDSLALQAVEYAAKEEAIREFTESLNRALFEGHPLPPIPEGMAS